jgi:hypothetical protein
MARQKQTARRTLPTRKQDLPSKKVTVAPKAPKVLRWRKSGFTMGAKSDRRIYFDVPIRDLNHSITAGDLKRYALEKQAEKRTRARLCTELRASGMAAPEPLARELYIAAYERNGLRDLVGLITFLVTHAKNGGDKIPADCTTCHGIELWRRGIIEIAQCKRRKALAAQTSPVITVSAAQAMHMAVHEQSHTKIGGGMTQGHQA